MFWWKSRRDVKDRSSQREPGSRPRLTDRHVPLSCSKVPTFLKERSDHEVPLTAGPRFQGGSAEGLNEHTHVWSPRFSVYQFQNPRSAVQMKQRGSAAASANTRLLRDSPVFMCFFWAWQTGRCWTASSVPTVSLTWRSPTIFVHFIRHSFFFSKDLKQLCFYDCFGCGWIRGAVYGCTRSLPPVGILISFCWFWDILFLFLRHQRLGGLHYCYGVMFYQETVL